MFTPSLHTYTHWLTDQTRQVKRPVLKRYLAYSNCLNAAVYITVSNSFMA